MIRKGTRVRFTRDYTYRQLDGERVTHRQGTFGVVTLRLGKGAGLVLPAGITDNGRAVLAFISRDIERAD
jgi:hypothetical protein